MHHQLFLLLAVIATAAAAPQTGAVPRPGMPTMPGRIPLGTPLPAATIRNSTASPVNGAQRPLNNTQSLLDSGNATTRNNNNSSSPAIAAANQTAGATTPAANSPLLGTGCTRTCSRKEVRQLSATERSAFIAALRQLQSGPAPTAYDRFSKIHVDAKLFAHGNAYFLPWHRAYLVEFERALQRIDPSVCLPYWNWSLDSQAPELAVVFEDEWFGGNGSGNGNCVRDGQFAQWRPYYPTPHCLERRFDGGNKIGALHSIESVNRVITQNREYDQFRRAVESGLHPGVHNNVGGDLAAMHSPNDPLFFLHHGFVEFLWVRHQKMYGLGRFSGSDSTGAPVSASRQLFGLAAGMTAAAVMDSSALCYEYEELQERDLGDDVKLPPSKVERPTGGQHPQSVSIGEIPAADSTGRFDPLDRSNIGSLRVPAPISDAWLEMNGQDVAYVRQFETEYRGVYTELNNLKGYKSPCALWSRQTLFAKMLRQSPKADLVVDVPEVGRVKVSGESIAQEDGADPYQVISDVKVVCVIVAPEVELPAESYSSELENVVGQQAFTGAGSLMKLLNPGAGAAAAVSQLTGAHSVMALATALAVILL